MTMANLYKASISLKALSLIALTEALQQIAMYAGMQIVMQANGDDLNRFRM